MAFHVSSVDAVLRSAGIGDKFKLQSALSNFWYNTCEHIANQAVLETDNKITEALCDAHDIVLVTVQPTF